MSCLGRGGKPHIHGALQYLPNWLAGWTDIPTREVEEADMAKTAMLPSPATAPFLIKLFIRIIALGAFRLVT